MDTREPIATTCPYCGVGCGVLISAAPEGGFAVRGDPAHPANLGRLCSKGAALADTLGLEGRLLLPRVHGREMSWDAALDAVAGGLRAIAVRHGPEAIGFYLSGQLLTEDYYVANKLAKGFVGTPHVDTNSRLCMASAVAGHKRAFGSDTVPCTYEDFEAADLVVLVGSNTAWCHPVLYQRLRRAKASRPRFKVVVIDPRRTATREIADLHLALRPGTDALLFNGLLSYLRRADALDWAFLEHHVEGFAEALTHARDSADRLPEVAAACGLAADDLGQFYRWFARTARTVTLFSQGINQSSSGTDKVNAVINCHLATGRIGKPGAGPFSITGQPNAMGGREVGGLATQLAAHMDYGPAEIERLARFWGTDCLPGAPGLKAVDLFQAVGEGRIKALWIMATNPLVSLPDADVVAAALGRCELVVVSDCVAATDTAARAHILLPAAAWGEKDGTVTNSERRISRQRAFRAPPGEACPDWWIITEVARRLGHAAAFPYRSAAEVFREHARLSAFENEGRRAFDIGALAEIDEPAYDALTPVTWPRPRETTEAPRPFADGRFYTESGKARMVAITPRPPAHAPDAEHPLILITGRLRDQWHTMTRTGSAPRLTAHRPEPLLALNPADARPLGLAPGQLCSVTSHWGRAVVRVELTDDQPAGTAFLPIHWSRQNARAAGAGPLIAPVTDPISGEPELKHTPVRVTPYAPAWHGFLLTRERRDFTGLAYWVEARRYGYWHYELAGAEAPARWPAWARENLGEGEWLELEDRGAGRYRGALLHAGRLAACLFVGSSHQLPPRSWLGELFARPRLDDTDRQSLLAGRPPTARADAGPTVCSCFGVGRNTLLDAIRSHGFATVEALGDAHKAGTHCGSCIPELRTLLAEARPEVA